MGTVVHAGSALGVVVTTGAATEFGKIAAGLGGHQLETEFQRGLRRFSMLLVYVAGTLTTSIFVINLVLHKPLSDSLLFSLAIAVGITPQLLPAVVSTSLAAGSRRMSRQKVLVKRLVCIEDLGDVDVLFTDKTGTLTQGRIDFMRALPAGSRSPEEVLRWGLLCTDVNTDGSQVLGGNPLDTALWEAGAARPKGYTAGRPAWVRAASAGLLRRAGRHGGLLPRADRGRQANLLPPRRARRGIAGHNRPPSSPTSSCCQVQHCSPAIPHSTPWRDEPSTRPMPPHPESRGRHTQRSPPRARTTMSA